MIDNHKECWYCGKATMEPVETWWKCRSCGATYVDPTPIGEESLAKGHRNIYNSDHYKVTETLTPSKRATLAAAKARAKKASVV